MNKTMLSRNGSSHDDATRTVVDRSEHAHSLDRIWGLVDRCYRITQGALLSCGVFESDVCNSGFESSL